jgi:hypothetical protein
MVDVISKSLNDASDHILLLDSSKTNPLTQEDNDEGDSFDDDDDDEDIVYNAQNSNKQSLHNNLNGIHKNPNKKRLINLSSSKLNKKLVDAEKKIDESTLISLFKYILMNFSFVLNVIV